MNDDYIGFIKLTGESIEDGVVSADSAAKILKNIDRLMNRAIKKEYPELAGVNLKIPVVVRKGSWEALIPNSLVEWVITAVGAGGTTYVVTAAKQLATNDIGEKGIKEAAKSSLRTLQAVIKLHKHLGSKKRNLEGVKFKDNNKLLSIPNSEGKYIDVAKSDFDQYYTFPEDILKELADSTATDQTLEVGRRVDSQDIVESITYADREAFGLMDDEDVVETDILFPELKHGDQVELLGEVTRGNNQSNSIGFKYEGHILTCSPKDKRVIDYRDQMFSKCIMRGTVIRVTDLTFLQSNRPRIYFTELEQVEVEDNQTDMFSV